MDALMRQYLFTAEFFALFPNAGNVELPVAARVDERHRQTIRRVEFIRENLPEAEFCKIFTRDGPVDTPPSVHFYFSRDADAAFFKLGASDL